MAEVRECQIEAIDLGRTYLWPGGVVYVCTGSKACPNIIDDGLQNTDDYEECSVCYPIRYADPRPTQQILDDMVKDIN